MLNLELEERCYIKVEKSLEKKYHEIKLALGEQSTFYMYEVSKVFPEMKKSSLYWYMSKLVEEGYLKRVRNGVYAFNEWKGKNPVTLSKMAEEIREILDETGFEYYISGLDILAKYMQHVPEQYPIIVFVEKEAEDEIGEILKSNSIRTVKPLQIREEYESYVYMGQGIEWVVLYPTNKFDYCEEGLAITEKAFVDLYYAITRNDYPLALQELVRIYENLVRLGNIDRKKIIAVAATRSLQYDIRFIVESRYITEKAMEFVEMLKNGG